MIISGSKDVTTAGTRERIKSSDSFCFFATIQAKQTNAGEVYVGGDTVSSSDGGQLLAGDSITFPVVARWYKYNLKDVWVDAATDGDGVVFVAEEEAST